MHKSKEGRKVKCDDRSKFSNLSNWKEEAWKKSGLQRDSNPWPPRYRCDALPTELWSHTLGAKYVIIIYALEIRYNNLCIRFGTWKVRLLPHIGSKITAMITLHFHLQPQYKYELFHIYFTWFHCTGRYELNKLTLLPMCGFIAQLVEHRTGIAEVMGSNPVEALIFFRLLLSNCLNWKIYCDDQTSLSSTTAVQIWIISYIFHMHKSATTTTKKQKLKGTAYDKRCPRRIY